MTKNKLKRLMYRAVMESGIPLTKKLNSKDLVDKYIAVFDEIHITDDIDIILAGALFDSIIEIDDIIESVYNQKIPKSFSKALDENQDK